MKTNFETLKDLASYTVNHLKQKEMVEFLPAHRTDLIDALATELAVSFATDEDINQQAIEEVEEKMGEVEVEDITETEMYNHARKEIVKGFNGEALAGLYMVESLHNVALRVKEFLMTNDLIEDVYASDEELIDLLVEKFRKFGGRKIYKSERAVG